ncbi:hypothetical protein ACE3NQ_08590 [Paenibacillus terreus]|uniref:REase associating with pPIWI RE domain-containing protein n=1 Tax=Paenibacillus terreus TaxID=1387834 RepID=A0ABV5B604_9BACL
MFDQKKQPDEYRNYFFDSLRLLARGICEMDERRENGNLAGLSSTWKVASGRLQLISLANQIKNRFPLTLDEQIDWWSLPLNKWKFPSCEEWFAYEEEESPPLLYDKRFGITDFCVNIAQEGDDPVYEQDTKAFVILRNNLRLAGKESVYRDIRKFLIENCTIDPNVRLPIENGNEELLNYEGELRSFYEAVPAYYFINGGIHLCPRCGWTLKQTKDGHFECDTEKCRRLTGNFELKKKTFLCNKLMRVKRGIRRYIVDPGLTELSLYERILKRYQKRIKLELYPDFDKFDIRLQFEDGGVWVIDLKDWSSSTNLAQRAPYFSDQHTWEKALLVFPDYKSDAYFDRFIYQYKPKAQEGVLVKSVTQTIQEIEKKIKQLGAKG